MSLPVPWVGSGIPSCHSGLQGQRAPGTGLGGAGATTTTSVPDLGKGLSFLEARHSSLATSDSLDLSLFFFFSLSEGVWGEGRSGPRTLSFVSGVIGDHLLRVPCASHSHQLFFESGQRFPLQCVGSGPQGQQKQRSACHTRLGLEGKTDGGWGQSIFPSS